MDQTKVKTKKGRKGMSLMIGCICGVLAVIIFLFLFLMTGKKERVIGTDIAAEDITQFYWTYSSTAYPPDYQRYHFYAEDGVYKFYHEKREGTDWPLTEAHITRSGTKELSEKDWAEFLDFVKGGIVKEREQDAATGGVGPALYLYWKGDAGKYQAFSFAALAKENEFEAFCEKLAK